MFTIGAADTRCLSVYRGMLRTTPFFFTWGNHDLNAGTEPFLSAFRQPTNSVSAEEHRADEQQQINLGWFKRGEFMEEFETIAFSMGEGEISPVFTTQLGFHVCTVTGRNPSVARPFDEPPTAASPMPIRRIRSSVRDSTSTSPSHSMNTRIISLPLET